MPLTAHFPLGLIRVLTLGGVAMLSACSQSTRSGDVLMSGDAPVPKDAKYPDFSKPLSSAMEQMTDEDAKKMEAHLAALGARRHAGTISEAEYWRRVNEMRKLRSEMPQVQAKQ